MSVILKRSEKNTGILKECRYACCTNAYGRNVSIIRRIAKRKDEANWRKDLDSA